MIMAKNSNNNYVNMYQIEDLINSNLKNLQQCML